MSIIEKIKGSTVSSLYSGVASTALYGLIVDGDGLFSNSLPILGTELPVWLGVLGTSFIGSQLGSLATDFITPKIPVLKDFQGAEETIVPAVSAGLATFITMKTLVGPVPLKEAFIIGAGGNLIGASLYKNM